MNKTYNVVEAVQAQKEYCKEYAAKHPEDWASDIMKDGKGFAPVNGIFLLLSSTNLCSREL